MWVNHVCLVQRYWHFCSWNRNLCSYYAPAKVTPTPAAGKTCRDVMRCVNAYSALVVNKTLKWPNLRTITANKYNQNC